MSNPGKAGGPVTENGKAVSKYNATRHGIRSPEPVIPSVEKIEDWEEHRSGILESIFPVGHLEHTLAERVALLSWRLHRVTRYETETIALGVEKVEEDLAQKRRYSNSLADGIHPEDVREGVKYARSYHRLLKKLPKLQEDKHISSLDANSILWSAVEHTDRVAGEEADPEEILENISIPGMPKEVDWEDYEGWTAGMVRYGVEAIARATKESLEELLKIVTDDALRKVSRAEYNAEQVEQDLKNMRRERLLPDDKTLEKVSRYEAHLSRLLFKNLHELEALQKHRSGGEVPLARLDVDGLDGLTGIGAASGE